ncbi:MAG TPA: condensation domain-containing protein [Rhizomicrobium sp.]|nr:condensation domain-containing protein [Rhizomicrobium sp.]
MTVDEMNQPAVAHRARDILGLAELERFPNALPTRPEHLWRLDGFAANVPFTNPMFVPMGAVADPGLLYAAVSTVVGRHEALRTRLALQDGRPVQIAENWKVRGLELIDVQKRDLLDDRPGNKSAVSEFTQSVLDLYAQEGFLCRAFRDEDQNVSLGFVAHGYFSDAWSSQVILRELRSACAALKMGQAPAFAPVQQYTQYALAQRRSLARDLGTHLSYWQQKFQSMSPAPLPYDQSGANGPRGRSYFFLRSDVLTGLLAAAEAHKLSLTLILMAAYQLSLARWTRGADILSAAYTADRVHPEFHHTVGFLVTNMPICARINRNGDLPTFLREFARDFYASYAHRELSCELYEAIFQPPKPFCASVFNFVPLQRNFFSSELHSMTAFDGTITGPDAEKPAIYRDLYLGLTQYPNGILGKVFYNAGAFTPARIETFIGHFRHVTQEIAADPRLKLKDLWH